MIAITVASESRRLVSPPRKSETPHEALAASASSTAAMTGWLGAVDRPRRGDRVELVRVVEDGRLGGLGGAGVVVRGDRVQ